MQIEHLEILLDVVDKGTFSAVAQARQVNASSISRTIQTLETELGFKLLKRTTRSHQLTEAGLVYCQALSPLLNNLALAKTQALDTQKGLVGTLRMTLPVGFAQEKILPLIPLFKAQHPALKLDILITDTCLDLEQERIDVAIRLGKVTEQSWVALPLMSLGFVACATPAFCEQHNIHAPTDLQHTPCLNFINSPTNCQWVFKKRAENNVSQLTTQVVHVKQEILATDAQSIKNLCIAHLGVALLPNWMAESAIANNQLISLFPDYQVSYQHSENKAWCVYPSRDYVPSKTRAFVDFLIQKFK